MLPILSNFYIYLNLNISISIRESAHLALFSLTMLELLTRLIFNLIILVVATYVETFLCNNPSIVILKCVENTLSPVEEKYDGGINDNIKKMQLI